MLVNLLIADTFLQVNEEYISLKYQKFSTEKADQNKQIKIFYDDDELFNEEYQNIKNAIQWYHNEESILSLRIFDRLKKTVKGTMVFSDDFRSVTVRLKNLGNSTDFDFIDNFMFYYFQVNLLFSPGIVLHAAAINWKNQGILFSAQSETGKSTQARLWCEHEGAEIINGDRPAITIRNDGIYAHGTPWTGSDPSIYNISKPIKAIVLIEQSPENWVERLNPEEAVNLLIPRVFMPYFDEYLTTKALDIVDQIIQKVPIYKLKCRPDVGAVEVLKKELSLLTE